MWSLLRPDSLTVWNRVEVRNRLNHYYEVMRGRRPAKYLVVKRIPAELSKDEDISTLWELHSRLSREFSELYEDIIKGKTSLDEMEVPRQSFLDLKIEIVKRMITKCNLCEWRCGVNRARGEVGACKLDSSVRVSTAFLHMGEEAPLVPSGTIFFTGCSFKCVFCQNWDISTDPLNGVSVTPKELASVATNLFLKGARNINYVGGNPDQQLHVIVESLKYMDVNVPLLWNSNMYMSLESLNILLDLIDIWLPDFKYGSDECALRYSKVPRYFEVVSRNHRMACEKGDMIIRHLVMPGHVECCTRKVLEWIAENCPRALVNIMDQYRPEHLVVKKPEEYPEIARRPSRKEIEEARRYADELGLCWRPVS
ncbi:MAG: pyruvate formate lyase-activating protein [Thermoprotei archaeon]|nr:MAG: pyruvate formate lyase-activating protein [Thermoprotei archaeon]